MSAVVIKVPPKEVNSKYRGFTITVRFDPEGKRWMWSAVKTVVSEIFVSGTASSVAIAQANARKKVDRLSV